MTIKDVARLAGVSVATVSRTLNASAAVHADTRTRVLEVARSLRFSPNAAARSLSTQRTHALGVILPDLYGEFFSELLRGMDQTAQRHEYHLLVSSSHHDRRGLAAAVHAMRGRVDGLLVMAPEVDGAVLADVLPGGVPTVLLNGAAVGAGVHAITVDNRGGARAMTRHLLALGHRRIGFLAGAAHNADARERERGHREALRAAGIARDPALEVRGDFTEEGGARGAGALMALAAPPTAIFAANDAMAVGALSTLRELGIAVPRRVAVVGFDDIPIARYMSPPLSSVHVDISTLGERATARLMEGVRTAEGRGSGDGRAPPHETLPTTLVIRDSCGARRKDG